MIAAPRQSLRNSTLVQQPDWRNRRAVEIIDSQGYATKRRDGPLVQRTVHFLREAQRAVTRKSIHRVVRQYPEIYTAFQLRAGNDRLRLQLKARALTGQTDLEIANALRVPRETIRMYLDLFLDVRHRLNAKHWIVYQVIGLQLDSPPSVEQIMLLHVWHRGPHSVEAWLDYLAHRGEPHDVRTELGRQRAWLDLLIDIQQLPDDPQTLDALWKRCHYVLGNAMKVVQPATFGAAFTRNRAQFLAEMEWEPQRERVFLDDWISEILQGDVDLHHTVEFAKAA